MLKWEKRGLVVRPSQSPWWRTHAMVPVPEHIEGTVYRIYFSGRDDLNRSHIGYVVLDLERPERLIETAQEPVLSPGELGCFDDNGVTPSCLVRAGRRRRAGDQRR
jgi:predicted GH43/DUF377 family glycosyl hydrolase